MVLSSFLLPWNSRRRGVPFQNALFGLSTSVAVGCCPVQDPTMPHIWLCKPREIPATPLMRTHHPQLRWSSGMIPASGAGGPVSRPEPGPGSWIPVLTAAGVRIADGAQSFCLFFPSRMHAPFWRSCTDRGDGYYIRCSAGRPHHAHFALVSDVSSASG